MRDYTNFNQYLDKLKDDVYAQPPDESHAAWAMDGMSGMLPSDVKNVLDVGCGQGFCKYIFEKSGVEWTGVTIGDDFPVCQEKKLNVINNDMTFLDSVRDASYDLVFARHSLEHSPFPILTLMEWRRVAKMNLILIAPAPAYWKYRGKNHYSMATKEQIQWWLQRSGWKPVVEETFNNSHPLFLKYWREELIKQGHLKADKASEHFPQHAEDVEYRFLCTKAEEITT